MKKHIVSKLTDTEWREVFRKVQEGRAKGIPTIKTLNILGVRSTHYAYARQRLNGATKTPVSAGFVQYAPVNGNGHIEVQVGVAKISVPTGNSEALKWVLETVRGL